MTTNAPIYVAGPSTLRIFYRDLYGLLDLLCDLSFADRGEGGVVGAEKRKEMGWRNKERTWGLRKEGLGKLIKEQKKDT